MTEVTVVIPEVPEPEPETPPAIVVPEPAPDNGGEIDRWIEAERRLTAIEAQASEALTLAQQALDTATVASEIALTEPEPEPEPETPEPEPEPDVEPIRTHPFHEPMHVFGGNG